MSSSENNTLEQFRDFFSSSFKPVSLQINSINFKENYCYKKNRHAAIDTIKEFKPLY